MDNFLSSIQSAATSPFALIAYTISAILFVFAGSRLKLVSTINEKIKDISEPTTRKEIIAQELNEVLPKEISAQEWIQSKKLQGTISIIISIIISLSAISVIALTNEKIETKNDNTFTQTINVVNEGGQTINDATVIIYPNGKPISKTTENGQVYYDLTNTLLNTKIDIRVTAEGFQTKFEKINLSTSIKKIILIKLRDDNDGTNPKPTTNTTTNPTTNKNENDYPLSKLLKSNTETTINIQSTTSLDYETYMFCNDNEEAIPIQLISDNLGNKKGTFTLNGNQKCSVAINPKINGDILPSDVAFDVIIKQGNELILSKKIRQTKETTSQTLNTTIEIESKN